MDSYIPQHVAFARYVFSHITPTQATLLERDAPHILAYQPATAVAEKFETMLSKGLLNSRVKDYCDIWMLSRSVAFDGAELRDAIAATFAQRGTGVPASRAARSLRRLRETARDDDAVGGLREETRCLGDRSSRQPCRRRRRHHHVRRASLCGSCEREYLRAAVGSGCGLVMMMTMNSRRPRS
jgi:hypothetical protein